MKRATSGRAHKGTWCSCTHQRVGADRVPPQISNQFQSLQGPQPRKRHVGLTVLKDSAQGDLRPVEGHALALVDADAPSQLQRHLRPRGHELSAALDRPRFSFNDVLARRPEADHRQPAAAAVEAHNNAARPVDQTWGNANDFRAMRTSERRVVQLLRLAQKRRSSAACSDTDVPFCGEMLFSRMTCAPTFNLSVLRAGQLRDSCCSAWAEDSAGALLHLRRPGAAAAVLSTALKTSISPGSSCSCRLFTAWTSAR